MAPLLFQSTLFMQFKTFLLTVFTFCSLHLFAQSEPSNFEAGITYAPTVHSSYFTHDPAYSFLTGITCRYHLSSKWIGEVSGIYAKEGNRMEDAYFGSNINAQTGAIDTFFRIDFYYTRIEIPVTMRYRICERPHFRWNTGAGISGAFFLKRNMNYTAFPIAGSEIRNYKHTSKDLHSVAIGINLSTQLTFMPFKRISFACEPFLRLYHSAKTDPGNTWTSGIAFSTFYRF